ncbi:hypothetical protein OAX78_01055, partial [Planctomycetota bacterium]|nr:hypothetical protein [Planctomycetota bacterium]
VIASAGAAFAGVVTSTVDPGLLALANNGGPTQTHALPAGIASSAKGTANAGRCGPTDQRGLPRRMGSCDVGAYEVQPDALVVTAGDTQTATTTQPFALSLTVSASEGGSALQGVLVGFSAPGAGASAALSAPMQATDAAGQATVSATANGLVGGPYAVSASASALTATFNLTNSLANVAVTGGDNQSAPISTAFGTPLEVTVTGTAGPLAGVSVTFAGSGGGADVVFTGANPVLTDAMGRASVTVDANATAGGPYAVTATALGVTANVSLTNNHTASAPGGGSGGGSGGGPGTSSTTLVRKGDKGCAIGRPSDRQPNSSIALLLLALLVLARRGGAARR